MDTSKYGPVPHDQVRSQINYTDMVDGIKSTNETEKRNTMAYSYLEHLAKNGDENIARVLNDQLRELEMDWRMDIDNKEKTKKYAQLVDELVKKYQQIQEQQKLEAESKPFAKIAKRAKDMKSAEHDLSAIVDIAKAKIVENYLAYLVNEGGESRTRAEGISNDLDNLAHRTENGHLKPYVESILEEYQRELDKRKAKVVEKQKKLEEFEKYYGVQGKTFAEIQGVQQDQQMSLTEWSKVDKLISNESSIKGHLDNLKRQTYLEDSDLEQIDLTFSIEELEDGTVIQKIEDFIKKLEVEEADLKQRRKKFGERLKSALGTGSKLDKEHTRIYRLKEFLQGFLYNIKKVSDIYKKRKDVPMEYLTNRTKIENELKEAEASYQELKDLEIAKRLKKI